MFALYVYVLRLLLFRTNRNRSGERRRETVRHVIDAGQKRHGCCAKRRLRSGHRERI